MIGRPFCLHVTSMEIHVSGRISCVFLIAFSLMLCIPIGTGSSSSVDGDSACVFFLAFAFVANIWLNALPGGGGGLLFSCDLLACVRVWLFVLFVVLFVCFVALLGWGSLFVRALLHFRHASWIHVDWMALLSQARLCFRKLRTLWELVQITYFSRKCIFFGIPVDLWIPANHFRNWNHSTL